MDLTEQAGSLPASTLAEVSAVVAIAAVTGAPSEVTRPWEIILAFLPWYAVETRQTIDALWALPARVVVAGICERLPALCADQSRVEAAQTELSLLIPLLQRGLAR